MTHTLKIATWNAGHRKDAWPILEAIDADIVLAQELPAPPAGHVDRTVFRPFAEGTNRPWGTAVWSRELPIRRLPITTSETDQARDGTVAVAEIDLPQGGVLTAISIHANDERISRQALRTGERKISNGYAVTTMHRVLSDLTGYLDDPSRKRGRKAEPNALILGGDFNCNVGFDAPDRQNNPAHEIVFARVAGFGLSPVLPVLPGSTHETMVRPRIPFRQLDYLYASIAATVIDRGILRTPELEARRDHLPVWAHVQAC